MYSRMAKLREFDQIKAGLEVVNRLATKVYASPV